MTISPRTEPPIASTQPLALAISSAASCLADHFRAMRQRAIETGDETCRLSQRRLVAGATDFVGETLRDAVDLKDAMRRIARGYNLLHGGDFNHVEERSGRLVYRITDKGFPFALEPGGEAAVTVMESVLILLHAMLSIAAGDDLRDELRLVRTRRARARPEPMMLRFWDAPVRFGAAVYSLEYASASGGRPVRLASGSLTAPRVYDWIIAVAEARSGERAHGDLGDKVRAALEAGEHDQAAIARRLGLSVATLRRRLALGGADFRSLRAAALNARAQNLLGGGRGADDVAEALGFADARSFRRAFKAWNGVTPGRFTGSGHITL